MTTNPHDGAAPSTEAHCRGLTKREHFAALALQGILADPNTTDLKLAAQSAVVAADLLIEQLNAEQRDAPAS